MWYRPNWWQIRQWDGASSENYVNRDSWIRQKNVNSTVIDPNFFLEIPKQSNLFREITVKGVSGVWNLILTFISSFYHIKSFVRFNFFVAGSNFSDSHKNHVNTPRIQLLSLAIIFVGHRKSKEHCRELVFREHLRCDGWLLLGSPCCQPIFRFALNNFHTIKIPFS